jgi:hypothetical protein
LSIVALDPAKAVAGQLAAFRSEGPFGAVLAWDLFNYVGLDALAQIGQWLAAMTRPGAPLFLCLATQAPYADCPGRP